MAKIEFKGFVQAHEGNRPWEIAEGHSVKEGEKWVTKSKTYHKVWLPREHGGLNEGDLVEITGKQMTPEKKNEHKPTPVVYADTVTVVRASQQTSQAPSAPQQDSWAPSPAGAYDNTETPF